VKVLTSIWVPQRVHRPFSYRTISFFISFTTAMNEEGLYSSLLVKDKAVLGNIIKLRRLDEPRIVKCKFS
jgi:hypothetical protein